MHTFNRAATDGRAVAPRPPSRRAEVCPPYHDSLAANLRKLAEAYPAVLRPHLLYDGDITIPMFDGNDIGVCNFRDFEYSRD